MTCRIAQSNKMAVRTQVPKKTGDLGHHVLSTMPLVFEGYPWLLYSHKLSELRNGNITPQMGVYPFAASVSGPSPFSTF